MTLIGRRNPRPVLERGRGDDRPAAGRREASAAGSTASASAGRPASSSRPRSRASCRALEEYSGSTMGNLPIGQGLSVTPMQMMAGYAAIANGGILQPAAADQAGRRRAGRREPTGRRVIDAGRRGAGADDARGGAGAGRHRLGGERARLHAGGQDRNGRRWPRTGPTRRPSTSPRSSASPRRRTRGCWSSVIVDQPQGRYYGGSVAAPAFGEIAAFALPYLGVPPE